MTERDSMTPGRADLRALDGSGDFADVANRVVAPALARFMAKRRSEFAPTLRGFAVPLVAAAAVVMAVGLGGLAVITSAPRPRDPAELLAQWIEANHVPTNGELLLTFQGYGK
jgi:hypothetical protein